MNLNNQVNTLLFHRNNNIPQINQSTIFKFKNIVILNIIIILPLFIYLYIYYFKIKNFLSSKNNILSNKEYLKYTNYNESDININYFAPKSNILNINNISIINLNKSSTSYNITREEFLYEKQKENIMKKLVDNTFKGTWESVSDNNINRSSPFLVGKSSKGNIIFKFEKIFELNNTIQPLIINIKNLEGKYIDNWIKLSTYSIYQNLTRKVDLLEETFQINGDFLFDFEKGEIFETTYKKEKCLSIMNITFPLKQIEVNYTLVNGTIISLEKIYTINPQNFTLFINSNCGFIFSAKLKISNITEEDSIIIPKIRLIFCLNIIISLLYVFGIISILHGLNRNVMRIKAINIYFLSLNSV